MTRSLSAITAVPRARTKAVSPARTICWRSVLAPTSAYCSSIARGWGARQLGCSGCAENVADHAQSIRNAFQNRIDGAECAVDRLHHNGATGADGDGEQRVERERHLVIHLAGPVPYRNSGRHREAEAAGEAIVAHHVHDEEQEIEGRDDEQKVRDRRVQKHREAHQRQGGAEQEEQGQPQRLVDRGAEVFAGKQQREKADQGAAGRWKVCRMSMVSVAAITIRATVETRPG